MKIHKCVECRGLQPIDGTPFMGCHRVPDGYRAAYVTRCPWYAPIVPWYRRHNIAPSIGTLIAGIILLILLACVMMVVIDERLSKQLDDVDYTNEEMAINAAAGARR
jgi:hypothetical protein